MWVGVRGRDGWRVEFDNQIIEDERQVYLILLHFTNTMVFLGGRVLQMERLWQPCVDKSIGDVFPTGTDDG